MTRSERLAAARAKRAEEHRRRNEAAVAAERAELERSPEERRKIRQESREQRKQDFEKRNQAATFRFPGTSMRGRRRPFPVGDRNPDPEESGVKVIVADSFEKVREESKMRRPSEDKMLRPKLEDKASLTVAFGSEAAQKLAEELAKEGKLSDESFKGRKPSGVYGYTIGDVRAASGGEG